MISSEKMAGSQQLAVKDRVAYFNISHCEPLFQLPNFFNLIATSDYKFNHTGPKFSVRNHIEGNPNLNPTSSYLADHALYVIHDLLKSSEQDIGQVYISCHRKVVVRNPIGSSASNYPGMSIAHGDELNERDLLSDKKSRFLIMRPMIFPDGIFGQYARKHSEKDFFNLLELAIQCGTLSTTQVNDFAATKMFFPGLVLGLIPKETILGLLEPICRFIECTDSLEFQPEFPGDPYQSRARSFFIERLLSFLFLSNVDNQQSVFKSSEENSISLSAKEFGFCINFTAEKNSAAVYVHGHA
jgi:hypothetical protein